LDGEQTQGEWPRLGWSAVDDVAQRRGYPIGQAADHVFVEDPSAGRDDAKRPTSPPVHPPHGFELIAHDFRGVGLTTRDPLRKPEHWRGSAFSPAARASAV